MPIRRKSKPKSQRRPRKFTRKVPFSKRAKVSKYSRTNKQKFINRSNPVAENKQLEGGQISQYIGNNAAGHPVLTDFSKPPLYTSGPLINTPTGAGGFAMVSQHWHFNPDSNLYQTHGFDDSQMSGRSVYQRLTAAKFLFKWPQPTMNTGINKYGEEGTALENNINGIIPEAPMSYKLYWGFVPVKLGLTGYTTPDATKPSAVDIENHINQRVKDYFNERTDRIAFIPKTTATIKIIGSRTLTPRADESLTGRLPTSIDPGYLEELQEGSIPDTLVKITWPINKKIHFEPTTNFSGDNPEAPDNDAVTAFYKNYDWMPFAVVVSWNHDKLPANDSTAEPNEQHERTRRCPQVLVNDITYYRDS